jgi:streptomycin 6-kinase
LDGGNVSLVLEARRADGEEAVLKLNFPEWETEHEADALALWAGRAAVLLLEHDRERRALLLERCRPGTRLWDVADEEEANEHAAAVARALWRAVPDGHPFRSLADEAAGWAEEIPRRWQALGKPFEPSLADAAAGLALELARSQGQQVLCNQDFHGGNVLTARREPWLAIDPKPLVGDREFGLVSLVRDRRESLLADPHPLRRMRRRLDQLSELLDLDRERLRGWSLVHALAWGMNDTGVHEALVACARLLLAAD